MATKSRVDEILLRCIGCGAVTTVSESGLACADCGDLLEVVFPQSAGAGEKPHSDFDVVALKALWRQRRASHLPMDESGVWRFREVLPALGESHAAMQIGSSPISGAAAAAAESIPD